MRILFAHKKKENTYMKKRIIATCLTLGVIAGVAPAVISAPYEGGITAHHYYKHYYTRKGGLYTKAEQEALRGDFRSALATCNKYIVHYGETPEIFYLMGNIRSMQNDIDGAIRAYDRAIDLAQIQPIFPEPYTDLYSDLQLHFLRGSLKIKKGHYRDAEDDYNKLISQGDNYHAAAGYVLRAEINYRKRNFAEFERDLNYAMTAEPVAVQELIGTPLGQKYVHLSSFVTGYHELNHGNYHVAIQDLNNAIDRNPKFYLGYAFRGYAKTEIGDYYSAMKDLDKAISLNPDASTAFYFRAYLNEKMNNPKSAARDYNTAARKNHYIYPYFADSFRLVNGAVIKSRLANPFYIPHPQYIPHPHYTKLYNSALPLYRRTIDGMFVY